ncbi:hypothetical protein [Rickettsiella endosymbiont of Dermanyssus gallinae]|nr:hypothetical protein [Rickettsiella endosymbiont of Dermanyssus gallinae]
MLEHGGLLTTEHYAISRRESLETYMPVNHSDAEQEDLEAKSSTAKISPR